MNKIELRNASFAYPNGYVAVDDISLTITRGERVAIVGQNGAGKTTAVKMMNGLHRPSSGDVLVNDQNTKDCTIAQISSKVGYVFQNPDDQVFNSTVRREIEFMPRYLKLDEAEIKRRLVFAVKATGLKPYINENPLDLPLSIRKHVAIAAILAIEPEFIIFDEPTAGQDLAGLQMLSNLFDTLEEKGMGIITISHDMEFVAQNFTRVIAMANKKIVADGTTKEVFGNPEVLEKCKLSKTQIGRVAERLGWDSTLLTVDDVMKRLSK